MKLNPTIHKHGFTLVELLVVIAIIAGLAALSTPVILRQVARSKATTALNNAKEIYKGLIKYSLKTGVFPPVANDANSSMAPLFATSILIDESPFFIDGLLTYPAHIKPDGNIAALEANTNVFHYFGPASASGWNQASSPGNAPLIATPVVTAAPTSHATMSFGDDFQGQGVILEMGGSAIAHPTSLAGFPIDDNGNVIQEPRDTAGDDVAFVGVAPLQ